METYLNLKESYWNYIIPVSANYWNLPVIGEEKNYQEEQSHEKRTEA